VLVGIGAGLVLDEFALILTLDDVYWAKEGRVSVEMVGLAAASLGIFLVFGSPFTPEDGGDVVSLVVGVVLHLLFVFITFRKGKIRTAVVGFFLPVVAITGAIRLARPGSPWARHFYRRRPRARAKAALRAYRHDRRWALSLEAFRLASGAKQIVESPDALQVGKVSIPVFRADAALQIRYSAPLPGGHSRIPEVSLKRLNEDPSQAENFRGKAVFVGATALSQARDRLMTPYEQTMSGIEIHAQAYETMAHGDFFVPASNLALIAFSRVYLGVHFWLDVLVGAALGSAIGTGMALATRRLARASAG